MQSKTILVTGGNRGIGLEICRQLAKMGHTVLMGSRNLQNGEKAATGIEGNITVKQLSVTDIDDTKKLASEIEQDFGQLDVLINNAGILIGSQGPSDVDIAEVKKIMETNFYGPWQLSQAMLPLLKKSDDGRIINMSSGMGEWANLELGGYTGYRLSKTSLNALTVQLAHELLGLVKVNAMCPGWVKTDMGGAGATRNVTEGADTAVWLATAAEIPTGKFFRDRKVIDW